MSSSQVPVDLVKTTEFADPLQLAIAYLRIGHPDFIAFEMVEAVRETRSIKRS
jgi:hypothetical protein